MFRVDREGWLLGGGVRFFDVKMSRVLNLVCGWISSQSSWGGIYCD